MFKTIALSPSPAKEVPLRIAILLPMGSHTPFTLAIQTKLIANGVLPDHIIAITPLRFRPTKILPSQKDDPQSPPHVLKGQYNIGTDTAPHHISLSKLIRHWQLRGYVGCGNRYDIPPERCSASAKFPDRIAKAPETDQRFDFEGAWFRALTRHKIPMLLICGSTQRFGFECGYNMHYDLAESTTSTHSPYKDLNTAQALCTSSPEAVFKRLSDTNDPESRHPVFFEETSQLRNIAKLPTLTIPSFHSHALSIDRNTRFSHALSELHFTAFEQTGCTRIVEGIERPESSGHFCIGIQGHPEAMHEDPFFPALVAAARKNA